MLAMGLYAVQVQKLYASIIVCPYEVQGQELCHNF